MSNVCSTLTIEIEPHCGASIKPKELKLVKPKIINVEGPYNDKDELLDYVELGKAYYYYATLENIGANCIDPNQVKWAVGYDTEKFEKQYYLFSGTEVKNNKVRISISIGGSKEIKNKITESFRIYAYIKVIPNVKVFVEVKKEKSKLTFPVLIARSMRRAGKTNDNKGNDVTREDITNLGFSLPADKNKLKKRLEDAFFEVFPNGEISKRDSRVEYALEKLEDYNEKSDDKLFSIYQNDMDDWAQGDLDDNLIDMIGFFKTNTNTSSIYEDDRLTDAIAKHSATTNFISGLSPLIGEAIRETNGDISLLKVADDKTQYTRSDFESNPEILGIEGLQELNSLTYDDKFSGLGISVDGTQAYNVSIIEYKLSGDSYTGKLELEILDHFGLDSPDILKDYISNSSLKKQLIFRRL